MLTASAVINGDESKLLAYDDCEHPVALQLGGSEPKLLAKAVKIGEKWNYDEVNLNIGNASYTVYTCDFTHEYININADYRN